MHIYIVWPETWNEKSRIVWQTREGYNEAVTYEFRKNLRETDIAGDVLRLNMFIESKEIEGTSMFHFFSPCHTTNFLLTANIPDISEPSNFCNAHNPQMKRKIHTDDCTYKLT